MIRVRCDNHLQFKVTMRSQSDGICLALRFQPIAFGISDHEQLDRNHPTPRRRLANAASLFSTTDAMAIGPGNEGLVPMGE